MFEITEKMRPAISNEAWAEIAKGERLAMELDQNKRALAVTRIQAELDRKRTEHLSVLGAHWQQAESGEPAPSAPASVDIVERLRRVIKRGLWKELHEGPLPAAPPPNELHEAVQDFCDLRDDCEAFGIDFPSANKSAEPEAVAAHLLKRAYLLTDQIATEIGDVDPETYSFDDEHKEIVADAQRRSRSISRVQLHNGFDDPTHHNYVRAALKRIAS